MATDKECFISPKSGKVVTAKGITLWSSVFQPRKQKGGKEGKFEHNILFPKEASLKVLYDAAVDAGTDKFAKAFREAGGKWPQAIASPFKKTSENDKLVAALEAAGLRVEDFPVHIAARTKDKPGVVGPNGKSEGIEPEQLYAGRWSRMTVDAYGYDTDGNRGVTFGLQNVQLLDNGDELSIGGSRVSAESEFEDATGGEGGSADSLFG